MRAGDLAGEGVGPRWVLLPEGPGQAAGEKEEQAQGQHQEEEAEDRREDHVHGGRHEGHLEAKRASQGGLRTHPVTLGLDARSKALGPKPWVGGCDLALFPGVNLWGLAQEG